ncbi:MAG: type IV pilus assembly protein PilM [Bdellovibrionaceae bacterium]|nr:type IV pilus assembly protein PilM [Bdellovibrionales bacterium]MCB9086097.1 type IV pilus assembly protein PilM [Pseudobdellovibrionaceae bacterium]
MFFAGKKIIGLDVGTSTIKLAEVDVSRKGAKLISFGLTPTPPGAVIGGEIMDSQAIAEAIRRMLAEVKTKRRHVATGLWGTAIIVKKITIPRMDENLVAEQIRWEAEQYIPFDVNEVNLEYKILENVNQSAETMDIILIAARQENVFRYAEIVESAGLICSILDVGGFALANCFEKNYGEMEGHVVGLLNIGASVTNFVVVESGEVVFCRDIPVGGMTYNNEVQKSMGISMEEAEALKIAYSSGHPGPEELGRIIQTTHEIVCDEIQGSLDFFKNTSSSGSITQCFVTGGGSRTGGLLDNLSRHIGLQVEIFDPFINLAYNDKVFSPDYISQIRDFSAVAMGLGMRELGDA